MASARNRPVLPLGGATPSSIVPIGACTFGCFGLASQESVAGCRRRSDSPWFAEPRHSAHGANTDAVIQRICLLYLLALLAGEAFQSEPIASRALLFGRMKDSASSICHIILGKSVQYGIFLLLSYYPIGRGY